MTDAAQNHLNTVTTAQQHAHELNTALDTAKTGIETAYNKIGAAVDEAIEYATSAADYALQAITQTATTIAAADQHVEASAAAGHSTHGYARAAQEASALADGTARALYDEIHTLVAALNAAKETATKTIMNAGTQTETLTEGARGLDTHLGEAETHIRNAIGSNAF